MGKMVSEASVAGLTGLSRERLRDLRGSLTKGDHYRIGAHGEVEFTKDGLAAVMDLIRERVSFGEAVSVDEPEQAPVAKKTADLIVIMGCLSRGWVKARLPGPERQVVRCRVRDNTYLRMMQTLKNCTQNDDGTWTFSGRCM